MKTKNVYLDLVSGLTGQAVDQTRTVHGLNRTGQKYCITMDYLKKLVCYPHGPWVRGPLHGLEPAYPPLVACIILLTCLLSLIMFSHASMNLVPKFYGC